MPAAGDRLGVSLPEKLMYQLESRRGAPTNSDIYMWADQRCKPILHPAGHFPAAAAVVSFVVPALKGVLEPQLL